MGCPACRREGADTIRCHHTPPGWPWRRLSRPLCGVVQQNGHTNRPSCRTGASFWVQGTAVSQGACSDSGMRPQCGADAAPMAWVRLKCTPPTHAFLTDPCTTLVKGSGQRSKSWSWSEVVCKCSRNWKEGLQLPHPCSRAQPTRNLNPGKEGGDHTALQKEHLS